ncbi:glutathione S-transferase family protein [Neorhizobium tomejilense]|uniref:glutathione S-transferase family protein n=1 Tax=Neorhizobium tomejilense TaxID=2093828 RepID=UPI003ED0F433
MMKLHWSPRSPFVRKVMIVLNETGLVDQVVRVRSAVAMAAEPNPSVLADNPLGKIPVLVTENGEALFDSRVICAYLTERAGMLVPEDAPVRLRQLRWEALGDGLIDILLLWRIERVRGDRADPVICDAFETKVRATMARLETEAAELSATTLGLGQVAVFCALGQLEFRWPGTGWKQAFPRLAAWFEMLEACPSFASTAVVDDGPASVPEVAAQQAVFTFGKA